MPAPYDYQSIDIKPLSGPMDSRSTPDAVPVGAWRYRQNIAVFDQGKACRRPGWQKYRGSRETYNNEDLHDQLLDQQIYYDDRAVPYSPQSDIILFPPGTAADGQSFCSGSPKVREIGRQPVTFLFEATSTAGVRQMLAGTQNRLYALNEGKGNWQIIADAYGGDPGDGLHRRWSAAQVNDAIVFTNNYDPPLAYIMDSAIQGCSMQAVSEIETLTGIGLTKAAVICEWKGCIFLADVEMDGKRIEYRVVWSRFNLPLNFTPGLEGGNGTAGFQDLSYGGRILAMEPLVDVLLIYTTKGIWQCAFVGGEQVFTFSERYAEKKNGEGCLAYRRTLISTGKEHFYMGRDGIYVYSLYLPQPERLEWIHRSTNMIFETISEEACDGHIGWFYPSTKEYWVSWVEQGDSLPVRTLVFNTQYQTSDVVDHGFSAFCNHAADDRGTLLDYLLSSGICTPAEIAANDDLVTESVKEGGYCDEAGAPSNPSTLPDRNTPIWTNAYINVDGRLVEDYTKPSPDATSLCTLLGGLTIEDLCQECPKSGLLVMASATDWALKEYAIDSDVYFREVSQALTPCGIWEREGYDSILRTGAQDYGYPKEDKDHRALELEYVANQLQVQPSALQMKIGYSAQAIDSNNDSSGRCALVWRLLKAKTLECASDSDATTHLKKGTRPNKTMNWSFLYTGRYFYYEMKITGINGSTCFSRLTGDVKQAPRSAAS